MRPDERELDDELRGHLAISVQERIARGEDPVAARRAALADLGHVPAVRDSMRRVWYSRWFDTAALLGQEMRIGVRSFWRSKGLAATVIITLALGIGANAAIFSVVRGVLLRPLVNRGEEALLYLRQSAPGIGTDNMAFSVPEIDDLRARATTIDGLGEFSTVSFTMIGIGDPRVVRAGVVAGPFFEVMGLQPVLGRLIDRRDDGPDAPPVAVLTHRFWTSALKNDRGVVGRSIRLGTKTAEIVGVLEPAVPYPDDTEIMANIASSPHHLEATMEKGRTHRMTEVFARVKPDVSVEGARAELTALHASLMREHPEAYSVRANVRLTVTPLRTQLAAPARPLLLILLTAAAVVFVIACSNVANLILARSVRRESELAVRAALGASRGALRRTLLAESLVLCGAGALLGLLLARPFLEMVKGFATPFSVRALEVTVDATLLWVGVGLAMVAAIALAFIPRLPVPTKLEAQSRTVRITPGTNRRLRVFATIQIAFSFVLLAAAVTLIAALIALRTAPVEINTRQILALDVPMASLDFRNTTELLVQEEMMRRIDELPGVEGVALSSSVPWRGRGAFARMPFTVDGFTPANGEEPPVARVRTISPGFFDTLGVPLVAGRDFAFSDRDKSEPVVIVTRSLAQRLFTDAALALDRKLKWTDPLFARMGPFRIVGITEDIEDEQLVSGPAVAVYHPIAQMPAAGRMFVHASGDPYALVTPIRQLIQTMSPEQPVERPATLEDVRAASLAPQRLNAFVLAGFAGVALLIAVVGIAGVLAFSVSTRTREFGVRLAVGLSPRKLLLKVLSEGASIVTVGIVAGLIAGAVFVAVAAAFQANLRLPGLVPILAAAMVLATAAVIASLIPAARAARVDVLQALRSE
jgi:predicted permease